MARDVQEEVVAYFNILS